MLELINNAWLGWRTYTEAGKLAALLLAIFLFLFLYKNLNTSLIKGDLISGIREKILFAYTAVMTLLCICPVTAAVFMLYQTKFYNYEWIWSYVPVTAVIAAGGSSILLLIWKKRYTMKDRLKAAFITVLIACVSVVCGSVGASMSYQSSPAMASGDYESAALARYDRAALLIKEIKETYRAEYESEADLPAICLWAPEEILAYARQCSADIQLLYGRNMWDNALNAYSYDIYPEEYEEMYEWIELASEYGEIFDEALQGTDKSGECVKNALAAGVNVIVLPGNTLEKTREEVAELTGVQAVEIEGYFVYIISEES